LIFFGKWDGRTENKRRKLARFNIVSTSLSGGTLLVRLLFFPSFVVAQALKFEKRIEQSGL